MQYYLRYTSILAFTGRLVIQNSTYGIPQDVYGTHLRDILGTK